MMHRKKLLFPMIGTMVILLFLIAFMLIHFIGARGLASLDVTTSNEDISEPIHFKLNPKDKKVTVYRIKLEDNSAEATITRDIERNEYWLKAESAGKVTVKITVERNNRKQTLKHTFKFYHNGIRTIEDLRQLENSNQTFHLKKDLDLSSITEWKPIKGFTGKLNGNGYTIKGLSLGKGNNIGLFETLQGEVSDLIVHVNIHTNDEGNKIGAIAGTNSGRITRVTVMGEIIAPNFERVGGITGTNLGTIHDSINQAKVKGYSYIGGIAGDITLSSSNFRQNINQGEVSGINYVGGITGTIQMKDEDEAFSYFDRLKIYEGITNYGDVKGNDYVGGIAGYITGYGQLIARVSNYGAIIGADYVGGIFGQMKGVSLESITNHSLKQVSGRKYVGGITGLVENGNLLNIQNNAYVDGSSYIGGIVGKVADNQSTISSSVNNGKIRVSDEEPSEYIGGIVGYGTNLNNNLNYGTIEVRSQGNFVGGVAGFWYVSEPVVTGNSNHGNIEIYWFADPVENVGGIAGRVEVDSQTPIEIRHLQNYGLINAPNSRRVGGIFGHIESRSTPARLSELSNIVAEVHGRSYVGGIFGSGKKVVVDESNSNKGTAHGIQDVDPLYGKLIQE